MSSPKSFQLDINLGGRTSLSLEKKLEVKNRYGKSIQGYQRSRIILT
ncbi:hypothetical protein D030_2686 [Vibrio parahaemolyticus AQ3810]|nr:hypothetical protein D040_2912 [Vibrio parahaemolyticus NIHCB0603]ETX24749.1 hypothetical protein D037_1596 [Vibrio parahaemolyticus IDH02640]EXF69774.1 hypothetical protein D030_2686 [Vibrio parahaemolyticus AQ3810]EXJ43592.1 hypothetical protein D049_2633 [Vibrio parahaemolyticus VPTS-2010]